MLPFSVPLHNFLELVSFVADLKHQREVWIDKKQGVSSLISLGELYNQFFDDVDLDGFIDFELEGAPLTQRQKIAIRVFRDALDAFHAAPGRGRKEKTEDDVLRDPEWNKLVGLAQQTLKLFGGESR